jgi:hypothetical protein
MKPDGSARRTPDQSKSRVMENLRNITATLPPEWKWSALFTPPAGYEREWREWLAEAQKAEETATLAFWAQRRPQPSNG